jgi:hypothetical protein
MYKMETMLEEEGEKYSRIYSVRLRALRTYSYIMFF